MLRGVQARTQERVKIEVKTIDPQEGWTVDTEVGGGADTTGRMDTTGEGGRHNMRGWTLQGGTDTKPVKPVLSKLLLY